MEEQNLAQSIAHLERCLEIHRCNRTMYKREEWIRTKGFTDYETYYYKANNQYSRTTDLKLA